MYANMHMMYMLEKLPDEITIVWNGFVALGLNSMEFHEILMKELCYVIYCCRLKL
jgi:hypothetical protein